MLNPEYTNTPESDVDNPDSSNGRVSCTISSKMHAHRTRHGDCWQPAPCFSGAPPGTHRGPTAPVKRWRKTSNRSSLGTPMQKNPKIIMYAASEPKLSFMKYLLCVGRHSRIHPLGVCHILYLVCSLHYQPLPEKNKCAVGFFPQKRCFNYTLLSSSRAASGKWFWRSLATFLTVCSIHLRSWNLKLREMSQLGGRGYILRMQDGRLHGRR